MSRNANRIKLFGASNAFRESEKTFLEARKKKFEENEKIIFQMRKKMLIRPCISLCGNTKMQIKNVLKYYNSPRLYFP